MTGSAKYLHLFLLFSFFVFMSVSTLAPTFYAGVVSDKDISRSIISERWMGISGNVEKGDNSLKDYKVGSLSFNSNQTGEVLSADVEGIKGGGYYLVFLPTNETLNPSNLENISESDLEPNGVFSQDLFPTFYPEYSERFDSPAQTFTDFRDITVDGEVYNASYANLSGSTDMHVLKYNNGSETYPAFVSPIDGRTLGNSYQDCYLSSCNFQALLPLLKQGNFSYSTNLVSRGGSVVGCGSPTGNTSLVVGAGTGSECIDIAEDDTSVDLYNSVLSAEDGCPITASSEGNSVHDFEVVDSETGICVDGANVSFSNGVISETDIALESSNAHVDMKNLSISSSSTGIALQQSSADMENVNLTGTSLYGAANSVNIKSYEDPLPVPEEASRVQEPLGSRVKINSLSDESFVDGLGIGYPGVNESGLEPVALYKYDISNNSYSAKKLDISLENPGTRFRHARVTGRVENFSIFSLYGRNIEGDQSSAGEGEQGDSNSGGSSGSGGGGSTSGGSGGGGALPAGGGASAGPNPEAVEVNLTMEQKNYSLNRGDTVSIEFSVNNTGDVTVPNISTRLESDWASVPRTFESLEPEEVRNGVVLATVPEQENVGVKTFDVESVFSDNIIDSENISVNISAIVDNKRVDVIESPSFLRLDESSQETIGLEVRNPSPRPIRSIEASFRGDINCLTADNQTYTVLSDSSKNLQVNVETSRNVDVCNDALVLRADGDVIGFTPMRVEITERTDSFISVPVYLLILVIWTLLLVLRIKSDSRDSFPWR